MPSLTSRLRAAVGLLTATTAQSAFGLLGGILPGGAGTPPLRGTRETLAAYATMPWLHSIAGMIGDSVASTQWQLYYAKAPGAKKAHRDYMIQRAQGVHRKALIEMSRRRGHLQEAPDNHPLYQVLYGANPTMTGRDLFKVSQAQLEMVGEAFWVKERGLMGFAGQPIRTPTAFWPIPSDWILATPTASRPTYRVSHRAWQGEIPDTEILWIKDPDPANPYGRGTGVVKALADEFELDEFTAKHLKTFYYNRARPDLIVTPEVTTAGTVIGSWSKEETQRLEQSWLQKSQGFWRVMKPFFSGVPMRIHELEQDFRSQQLVQLREHVRNTIMQVWRIPPEVMGVIENSNRSTIEGADYHYQSKVILPRVEFLRAVFQERLVPEFDERLIIDYVSPVQEDKEHALKVATAAPWSLSVDEWRGMQGRDELENGHGKLHAIPFSTSFGEIEETPELEPMAPEPLAPTGGTNGNNRAVRALDRGNRVGLVRESEYLATTKSDALQRIADKLEPKLRAEFLRAVSAVKDKVSLEALTEALEQRNPDAAQIALRALESFPADLRALTPVLRDVFLQSGVQGAEELAALGVNARFDLTNPRAVNWARQHAGQLITGINDETREAVRSIVATAFESGLPPRESAKLIRNVVGLTERQGNAVARFRGRLEEQGIDGAVIDRRTAKFAEAQLRDRAKTIARTETINASAAGQLELWNQAQDAGLVSREARKVWITTHDDRLDERVCEPMDEQSVLVTEMFTTGDGRKVMAPTAHPRCRCAMGLRA